MTRLYALDLSGDRAALHLWDGAAWHSLGTAAETGAAALPRELAALLTPAVGAPVAVVLPEDQIRRRRRLGAQDPPPGEDVPDPGGSDAAALRTDWHEASGTRHEAAVPVAVLAETENFLQALKVVPAGCLAAPQTGGMDKAAWFGCVRSPVEGGRATDRPAMLGRPEPVGKTAPVAPTEMQGVQTDVSTAEAHAPPAPARARALDAARRDPAHLAPLPEDESTPRARRVRRPGPLPRGTRRLAALVGLLALGLGGLALRTGAPDAPAALPAPLIAADVTAPTRDTQQEAALPAPQPATAPVRAALPDLPGRDTSQPGATAARVPAPELARMDVPVGMDEIATFFTPPPVLTAPAARAFIDGLTLPGIDPSFRTDALALDQAETPPGAVAAATTLTPPGPPAQVYVVDENGLIRPSAEGRRSPDGFLVVAGSPPAQTRPRPERIEPETVTVLRRADLPEDDPLRRLEPRLRPDRLTERFERDRLGGKTETELALFAPRPRPASAQESEAAVAAPATAQAVALGPRPTARSAQKLAAFKAAAARTPVASIAATEVETPRNTSPKAATDRATTNARLNLAEVNLLGTFGSSRSPRALVRLPSGRVINVSVGDRVDGGRVAGISDGRLNYVKSGRTLTLTMPRG
ncbi:hypothetical protein DKT77_03395 [Meridianimarinicoccus roseus]|uniref:Type IV pilus biogenesis protein PilP n=1 Tax=Meridianimarinicoccus roseus TaxID=2072018 RepID=A0A2V2LPE5_9RHOB|nr:hypothetical protein [Meridianimarinicoccus roseus]PWR04099.1 hypothetical protein DKT77_03395 [Meridianimarinicoccus roseus]